MALQAELPLRRLLRDAQGTVQRVQGLRTRLEEYVALPLDSRPPASRGHAAVLAVTILGSAAAERLVEVVRWVERHLEFVRTLWPLALLHSLYSRPLAEEAEAALARAAAWPPSAGLVAMEYETTTAEDEAMGSDGDEVHGAVPQAPECGPDEPADEGSPLGVNLYLYMEEDLEEVAENLISIPKLANAIAEGLIVCRRVNVCFNAVMGAQRETARLLLRASEQVVPEAVEEALEAVDPQTLRALEAVAVEVYEAVRSVLNALQRSVALMQAAMDGVEICAKRRTRAGVGVSEQALVPLTRLAEEAARTASDARGLEEFVSDVVDRIPISERPDSNTLGGGRWVEILTPDAVYTSEARARMRQRERGLAAHVAIRVAAYMGWKAAEQASHVAQVAAGVVACASLARSVVAMRFRETPAQRRERALRRPLVEAWRRAAAPDEDRTRARAESDDDTDAENTADQPSPDVPRPDQDDEGPLVERNTLWRLFVEGCDWWSARTALAKARRRSRLATALARALMELRALYRPMEEVAVASWDARRMLHSRRHAADPLNERVAEHLAAAAGAAGGEVRRLLRVVQQMHATLLRAVQTLAADGHDLLDEHSHYPLPDDSLNQRSLFFGLGLPLA